MKKFNFIYPLGIILIAVVLGFFFNYKAGFTWDENLKNMQSQSKIVTYLVVFVAIFIWKNWKILFKN